MVLLLFHLDSAMLLVSSSLLVCLSLLGCVAAWCGSSRDPQIAVCGLQSTNNITACLAARRYQISHRVWKNIPCVSAASEWNIFEHEKRNFVSLSGHVKMFYLCINQWNTKPFHLNVSISYIKYAPYNIWLDFSFVLQLPAWRLFAG